MPIEKRDITNVQERLRLVGYEKSEKEVERVLVAADSMAYHKDGEHWKAYEAFIAADDELSSNPNNNLLKQEIRKLWDKLEHFAKVMELAAEAHGHEHPEPRHIHSDAHPDHGSTATTSSATPPAHPAHPEQHAAHAAHPPETPVHRTEKQTSSGVSPLGAVMLCLFFLIVGLVLGWLKWHDSGAKQVALATAACLEERKKDKEEWAKAVKLELEKTARKAQQRVYEVELPKRGVYVKPEVASSVPANTADQK